MRLRRLPAARRLASSLLVVLTGGGGGLRAEVSAPAQNVISCQTCPASDDGSREDDDGASKAPECVSAVVNSKFEQPLSVGWTVVGTGASRAAILDDDADYELRVTDTSQTGTVVYQDVVIDNPEVTITCRLNGDSGSDAIAGSDYSRLKIVYRRANGSKLGATTFTPFEFRIAKDSFQSIPVNLWWNTSLNLPSEAASQSFSADQIKSIRIEIAAAKGGRMYVDDIRVPGQTPLAPSAWVFY